ncbi:autotransporter outer membrane beta-barrel domain-containing protein [Microbulbifer bruguierae]|uniref:Autotransporter outer membrane beta-barrel domain-containing protein n=1 Tax=Microbulbifer bruguierae TaxID=3029061 RepID=A0ABY8NCM7_9GAMM|nr:autotransporter outer membrane beta-barrel domain-containing protein [Microbulbifer bruguierae]WGL16164.1 autotransporter outer membrane beta-barrel domain-containing protein [Microbulbifer bruguierae]
MSFIAQKFPHFFRSSVLRIFAAGILTACLFAIPTLVRAECSPSNTGTAGPDQILCDEDNDAEGADVSSFGGNDTLDLNGGTIGTLDTGAGDDLVNINGAVVETNLLTGDGDDTVTIDVRESEIGNYFGGGLDTGAGNDHVTVLDGLIFELNTGAGNDDILLDGGFIFDYLDAGDGDDIIYWDEGIVDVIRGGDGSDYLRIDAFAYEGDAILDGGDDLTADDGYVDTLRFHLDHEIDGGLLQNWEHIIVNGSSKLRLSGNLAVGGGTADGEALGLDIRFGGIVEFLPRDFIISGDVVNAGTLWLADDRFNTLTIAAHDSGQFGNYTGRNSRLWIDTHLGRDDSPSDLLTIAGNASGQTFVRIFNRNGAGRATRGDGIKVIEVGGNAPPDTFILDGDYLGFDGQPVTVAGAYGYTLHSGGLETHDDGGWYLRSTLPDPFDGSGALIPRWQAGAVLYETYAQVIRQMNEPGTLRQRLGNRFWAATSFRDRDICCYSNGIERTIDGGGLWLRAASRYSDHAPERSTSRAEWQQDYGLVQIGSDFSFDPAVYSGRLMLGVFAQYGYGNTELDSFFGHGEIDTDSFGVGTTLTWYGSQGTYADLLAQFNWFDSDLLSYELYYLGTDNDAVGFTFSAEAGHSFKLCNFLSLTPQAQFVYAAEEIDDNRDPYHAQLKDTENGGSSLRLGLALEQRVSQRINRNMYGNLLLERFGLYAIANAYYYFDDDTEVKVSHTSMYQGRDEWWGQLGVGFTYDQCGDRCSVYGEAGYATSLENFGDSYQANLTFGFRFKW